ncbi:LacI family transcriptional regulator [Rouxiella silvae]|uniref:LacI family transcriptional regulator n=1 Tax=Rouxiella silvae TaxID=1646373 RepID=A0ABX3TUS3_9GAMM|nr:LacI family DNA-binding transcriptional regulator [Rouxiella silvae]KQN48267.1 LacI family transcriptional regulator [Serratia sp. Leaf50]ORJ18968.1 LacI family transcriptional regulator [Rouxiella silvae]
MKKNITIKDIAEIAGVSITTVSRVLNNNSWVSDKTKAKVQKVIAEYSFSPNLVARGMISKKSDTLAVVVSDITNPYFVTLVAQIEQACLKNGYKIILFDTQSARKMPDSSQPNVDVAIFNSIMNSQLDGAIILGGDIDYVDIPTDYLSALKKLTEQIPTVVVGREIPQLAYSCITRDQTHCVRMVTQRLIDRGYKNIAFIGGSEKVYVTQQRVGAFYAHLQEARLPIHPEFVILNDFYIEHGYQAIEHLLGRDAAMPDAILAINDRVAMGVIRALKDNHVSVPEDNIAVASCEYFPGSEYFIPRITTADHQNNRLGQAVIATMIALMQSSTPNNELITIPPLFLEGESC